MDMNVTMKDPKKSDYYYEESIKTLRTNIQFSSKQVKTILLTRMKEKVTLPLLFLWKWEKQENEYC